MRGPSERTKAEMAHGAKLSKINMANGLVEQLMKELDPGHRFRWHLISDPEDVRQWGVRVDFGNGQAHAEDFFDFPTNELRTKIMLFGG